MYIYIYMYIYTYKYIYICICIYRRKVQRLKAQAIGTQEYSPPDAFLYSWSFSLHKAHLWDTSNVICLMLSSTRDALFYSWITPPAASSTRDSHCLTLSSTHDAFLYSCIVPPDAFCTRESHCLIFLSICDCLGGTREFALLATCFLYSWRPYTHA